MITPVIMPKLGLTMDAGTILDWHKKPGEAVNLGEALLTVETDKVALDIEVPAKGMLLRIVSPIGAVVPLGEIIAYIGEPGEEPLEAETAPGQQSAPANQPPLNSPGARKAAPITAVSGDPIKVSPIARRLAEENGLDLALITGSGPGGRIIEADIQAALSARAQPASSNDIPFVLQDLSAIRKTSARRMLESWQSIPHFFLGIEINASPLVTLRSSLLANYSSSYGVHLTYSDLILAALARTLPKHPLLNASFYSDSQVKLFSEINPGIAIATDQGLVVGIIHQADLLPLWQIARQRQALVARAQERHLNLEDVSDGTFTFTNLGMYGIDDFSPIIYPGQAAILAAGAILDRPVNVNHQLVLGSSMRLTLAVDHRVADGAAGSLFLKDLHDLLENPGDLAGI